MNTVNIGDKVIHPEGVKTGTVIERDGDRLRVHWTKENYSNGKERAANLRTWCKEDSLTPYSEEAQKVKLALNLERHKNYKPRRRY